MMENGYQKIRKNRILSSFGMRAKKDMEPESQGCTISIISDRC